MALHAEDRTEPPTPRRRSEARAKGQVARSHDLTAATVLVASFAALAVLGPGLWHILLAIVVRGLSPESPTHLDDVSAFVGAIGMSLGRHVGPLLVILFLAGLAVLYAQVGWLFTWQPITPSLAKINPLKGLARLFSIRATMAALISFAKVILVGVVAYFTVVHAAAAIVNAFALGFHDVVRLGASLMFELGMKLSVALLFLALLDYAWQRFRHERDLRMTKEEVKDELRSMEGDPHIKRRRRQLQLQLHMQRLRKDVPKADVVVTNPTHIAVAIAYKADAMAAPKVVAKGADYLAIRIRQIAVEFGIPIVERKPLARALYESVEVGQYIPERFYRAVAEILAYIYELTGRSPRAARAELAGVSA
jgi:flagellar biosynthetic protein FlhB